MTQRPRNGLSAVYCETTDPLYRVPSREWLARMGNERRALEAEIKAQQDRFDA